MKYFIIILGFLFSFSMPAFAQSNADGGWVQVSLNDVLPFNPSCEYRVSNAALTYYADAVTHGSVTNNLILRGTDGPDNFITIVSNKKYIASVASNSNINDIKSTSFQLSQGDLEERCVINQVPSGQISLFKGQSCPNGWSRALGPQALLDILDKCGLNYRLCIKN